MYQIVYSSLAQKDANKLARSNLKDKCLELLKIICGDPYKSPPPYKKLVGELAGCFSRRINIQHRLLYKVYEEDKVVKVLRMWSHYENI